jgi:hypothetical protein
MFYKTLTIFVVALVSSIDAHFSINAPVPIPGSAVKDPLEPSGSDFPCHGVDLSIPATRTPMVVGDDQPLAFDLNNGTNTAVHGGGSCQISVTYETDKGKVRDPTNWKVIKSYIGGCPTNSKGNLATAVVCNGQNSPDCVNRLSFVVPPEVKDGNATLAWTWFNNVGDREMYMNCAAVRFTGGRNQIGALPDMFVANLASINSCKTTESTNTDVPDPGKYVQKDMPLNYPLQAPVGCGVGSRPHLFQTLTTPMSRTSSSTASFLPTGATLRTVYGSATETASNNKRAPPAGNAPNFL